MTTITETQTKMRRLVSRSRADERIPIVVLSDNSWTGACRAVIVSNGHQTAGVLLMPDEWQDPPGDYRTLTEPVDTIGRQIADVLEEAGIRDIRLREATG